MQHLAREEGLGDGGSAADAGFDAKQDLGKPLLRRLQRARVGLRLAHKFRLPGQRKIADSMWRGFLESLDGSILAESPPAVTGAGEQGCAHWRELKYWTFIASCFEQHRTYEVLLLSYDESLSELAPTRSQQVRFFGSGHGRSTLNTYRLYKSLPRLEADRPRFEKVYSNAFDDVQRVVALESVVGRHLRDHGIMTPPILSASYGRRITVAHYAFVQGSRIKSRSALARGADVVETLMAAPVAAADMDPVLLRYHETFIEALANAGEWVARRHPERSESMDSLARLIEQRYPRFLAHGDLHRKNMFNQGGVVDWDNGGLYPIGFDPGLILSKSVRGGTVQHLEAALRAHFLRGIARDYEPYMIQGALFFAFVFGAGKKSALAEPLLTDILDRALALTPGEVA